MNNLFFPQLAAPSSESLDKSSMPEILKNHIAKIEEWAIGNEKDAKRDKRNLWMFKYSAIVISLISSVFGYMTFKGSDFAIITVFAGVITSSFIALDEFLHPGNMYKIHMQAFHDLRNLESKICIEWDKCSVLNTLNPESQCLPHIFEIIEKERDRISGYLKAVEAGQFSKNS
jgi:hypothetical protein